MQTPLLVAEVRQLGGALNRASTADGPTGAIEEPYQLFCVGVPFTPDMAAEIEISLAATTVAMQPYLSDRTFFNFLGADDDPTRAFSPGSLTRLRQIKRQYDPSGVFVSNRPVLGRHR